TSRDAACLVAVMSCMTCAEVVLSGLPLRSLARGAARRLVDHAFFEVSTEVQHAEGARAVGEVPRCGAQIRELARPLEQVGSVDVTRARVPLEAVGVRLHSFPLTSEVPLGLQAWALACGGAEPLRVGQAGLVHRQRLA